MATATLALAGKGGSGQTLQSPPKSHGRFYFPISEHLMVVQKEENKSLCQESSLKVNATLKNYV